MCVLSCRTLTKTLRWQLHTVVQDAYHMTQPCKQTLLYPEKATDVSASIWLGILMSKFKAATVVKSTHETSD